MLIRMPKTILMSEPCGMENLKKEKVFDVSRLQPCIALQLFGPLH